MASRDLKNDIKIVNGVNITSITTNTTTAGVEVDTQGFESVTVVTMTGARTDGTVTPLLQESDVTATYSGSVADEDLIGLEADAALSLLNARSRFGYIGKKRYIY